MIDVQEKIMEPTYDIWSGQEAMKWAYLSHHILRNNVFGVAWQIDARVVKLIEDELV